MPNLRLQPRRRMMEAAADGCDYSGDEGDRVYGFKTIASIKAELKKMGF